MWLDLLQAALLFFGSEKDYLSRHYALETAIADSIRKSSIYSVWKAATPIPLESPNLRNSRAELAKINETITNSGNAIYNITNDAGYFLSIDLKAANFQIIKRAGFTDKATWKEFLVQFIDVDIDSKAAEYFDKSKLLRFKAISRHDLKEHVVLIGNIVVEMLDAIIAAGIISDDNFVAFNGDELVFRTSADNMHDLRNKCIKFLDEHFGNYLSHVEIFQLFKLHTSSLNHYVKINQITQEVLFKGVCTDEFLYLIDVWEKQKQE
jgi:hypothetical protein